MFTTQNGLCVVQDDNNDDFRNDVCNLKQFVSVDNFRPVPYDFTMMPLNVNYNINNSNYNDDNTTKNQNTDVDTKQEVKTIDETNDYGYTSIGGGINGDGSNTTENYSYGNYENMVHVGSVPPPPPPHSLMSSNASPYYYMYNSPYPNHGGLYMPSSPIHCVQQAQQTNFYPNQFYHPMQPTNSYGGSNTNFMNFSPAPFYHHQSSPNTFTVPTTGTGNGNINVNFSARKSILRSGSDLPSDISTLQYFFNLGIDYYRQTQMNLNLGK